MASADEFAAMFYGEPGVLGLLANGISAFLVLLQNFNGAQTGVPSQGVEHILAGKNTIYLCLRQKRIPCSLNTNSSCTDLFYDI